ncbi:MAG: chromosome segregation protein SMC [Gammaproteobacteria bacterium]|nr:chromosome segregation protein SMC [Gammaproteobacteria bacterium]
MYLKKVKFAGFKSFADPTTMLFRSNRTGIVGPNGCGKSNIIDGVRWVMGESSAKQLRGEAMADVVFNGSNKRKPMGQASIELFFDNSSGKIGGEFAPYNEIAVRREVNRDGASNYYLNSKRCRRKDIVDIFLGTGLGPRSYSIIEQGMISQLIEAKPEELRSHLEEAAGISKYKERRRETENRIRHTRENLERLTDIREELATQLRRLKRQANAAERYKVLKQEQRLLKAQIQALHWRAVMEDFNVQNQAISEAELELEARLADHSNKLAEIAKTREEKLEADDKHAEVQEHYYKVGGEVGRLEQQLQHNKERCTTLEKDLARLQENREKIAQHIGSDEERFATLSKELLEVEPQTDSESGKVGEAELILAEAEAALNEWQIAWDSFNSEAAETVRKAEVEEARLNHIEQGIERETGQLGRLQEEIARFDFAELEEKIATLKKECDLLHEKNSHHKQELLIKQQDMAALRENNQRLISELDELRLDLQKMHGRESSLEALQQAALSGDNKAVKSWLSKHSLLDNPRLAQGLRVESGWEKAVEVVLGQHLEALAVDNLNYAVDADSSLEEGKLVLFNTKQKKTTVDKSADKLISKVDSDWVDYALLEHVYIAENLNDAIAMQANLKSYESIVTSDGVWVGPDWISLNKKQDSSQGVLKREKELKNLKIKIKEYRQQLEKKEEEQKIIREKLFDLEAQIDQRQSLLQESSEEYSQKYAELSSIETRLSHQKERFASLERDIVEHKNRIAVLKEQKNTVHAIWSTSKEQKLSVEERRAELARERSIYQEKVVDARNTLNHVKEEANALLMRVEFGRNQRNYLQENLSRSRTQLADIEEQQEQLTAALMHAKEPLSSLEETLNKNLDMRLTVEEELRTAKIELDNKEHELRDLEQKQDEIQNLTQELRDRISSLKMEAKALEVRSEGYLAQVDEAGFELKKLLEDLSCEATINSQEESLLQVSHKIERLGPINLAAIDEYKQQEERKNYLDAQNNDLEEALATLESAMAKIDRETRIRFKNTFEAVNQEFQRLFPLVFGGGSASLELTENDLLNTGVLIMAQPPGKRNSTIHLLSGGEKALTAIALVFSIFQLNPAPFCMLDEVDAPLDDNNVMRFCNLVKEISDKIQIIFITHNKTTMEMANQLAGITMHEPGVSRIVSVDVDEAVKMADK